jgi:hypothetical protein
MLLGEHKNPHYTEGFVIDNFNGEAHYHLSDVALGGKHKGFTWKLHSYDTGSKYYIGLFDRTKNDVPDNTVIVKEDTLDWKQRYNRYLRNYFNEEKRSSRIYLDDINLDIFEESNEITLPPNYQNIFHEKNSDYRKKAEPKLKVLLNRYLSKPKYDDYYISPTYVILKIAEVLDKYKSREDELSQLYDVHFAYIVKSMLLNEITIESLLDMYCRDIILNYYLAVKSKNDDIRPNDYLYHSIMLIDIFSLIDIMCIGMKFYERKQFLSDLFGSNLLDKSGSTVAELKSYLSNLDYDKFFTDVLTYNGVWKKYTGTIPDPTSLTDVLHLWFPDDNEKRYNSPYRSYSPDAYYFTPDGVPRLRWNHQLIGGDESTTKSFNEWGVLYKITNIDGV